MTGRTFADRRGLLQEAITAAGYDALVAYGVGALGQFGPYTYASGSFPSNKGAYVVIVPDADPIVFPINVGDSAAARENQLTRLADFVHGAVGIAAGPQGLPFRDEAVLRSRWGGRVICDASPTIDRLRRNARGVEHELRVTAKHLECALEVVEHETTFGDSEREVAARVRAALTRAGAIVDIVEVSTNFFRGTPPTDRSIADGDVVTVFAEAARADGQWVELGAAYLAGTVGSVRHERAQSVVTALNAGVTRVAAGVTAASVWEAMSRVCAAVGPPAIGWGHAAGLDEGPLQIRHDASAAISHGDVIALHPSISAPDGSESVAAACTVIAGVGALSNFPSKLRRIRRRS